MALPPKAFFTLAETAARWGCLKSDIAGWAAAGHFQILAGISPVRCGANIHCGMVEICAADLMPMFRNDGSGPEEFPVLRIRSIDKPDGQWEIITDPASGVPVSKKDLRLRAADVERFEDEHDLLQRGRGRGGKDRYDWDGMYVAVCKRIHESGLPETQAEFVAEMQEWFMRRLPTGDAPDERTIRRRLTPVWRELRGEI